jgi:hypothetical protein
MTPCSPPDSAPLRVRACDVCRVRIESVHSTGHVSGRNQQIHVQLPERIWRDVLPDPSVRVRLSALSERRRVPRILDILHVQCKDCALVHVYLCCLCLNPLLRATSILFSALSFRAVPARFLRSAVPDQCQRMRLIAMRAGYLQ